MRSVIIKTYYFACMTYLGPVQRRDRIIIDKQFACLSCNALDSIVLSVGNYNG